MNKVSFQELLPNEMVNFEEYVQIKERLVSKKKGRVNPFDSHSTEINPKIVWKYDVYLQCNLYRSLDCLNIIEQCWENEKSIGCFIVSRNFVENVAHLYDVLIQTERLVEEKNFNGLNDLIGNRLFGSKLEMYMETSAVSILTVVKKVDKTYKGFEEQYNLLCELAHPNYFGMLGHYGVLIEEDCEFHIDNRKTMSANALGRAFSILSPAVLIYDHFVARLIEMFPSISEISDEDERQRNSKGTK